MRYLLQGLAVLLATVGNAHAAIDPVDVLKFGDPASEQAHRLTGDRSEVIRGALGEPARRLLPPAAKDWRGGSVAFELGVAPQAQNYVTVTLWGGEESHDYLALSCEGRQIGSRHLGDPDVLDLGSQAPMYEGRFFHNTSPLPLTLTKGKKTLSCRIDSSGPVWAYGQSFEQFQKPMTEPSRAMYVLTVHTDPFLPAGAMELKGRAPTPKVRPTPGPEVLDALERRVGGVLDKLLAATRPLNQPELQFVARAYDVDWTSAYHNEQVGPILVRGLDAYFNAFRAQPNLVGFEPSTFNPEWFGLGPAGQAIMLRHRLLEPFLDESIADPKGGEITRRAAYVEMLVASREWHRAHRRFYTNQSMINDTYGIYLANRGVEALDPSKASPEKEMLRYLYESVGLQPWRGDDLPGGGHRWMAGGPDGTDKGAYVVGEGYHEVTDKGLTRELGYVGNYGEVLDWVGAMYEATRPSPDEPGDPAIRAQLLKIAKARASFRYPLPDADGYRAMRLETVVGWRDIKYPGDVTYGQRAAWDASSLQVAAITRDPTLIAYAQQMFEDNQLFHSVQESMKVDNLRVNMGLLNAPGEYAALTHMPRQKQRLPMSEGEPAFVFSDEEDGVIAVKVGKEILYASLYWRSRSAVNGLAKVHYLTPQLDRMAVVCEDVAFDPSGELWTRPDMATWGFVHAPAFQYPGIVAAHTGQKLPIAKAPQGIQTIAGDESPYAGKAEFYTLRYGPFTVGVNTTKTRTFEIVAPDQTGLRELVSDKTVAPAAHLSVGPRSTVVLYREP